MGGLDVSTTTEPARVIACTRENAADFRALIAAWPELQALTDDLRGAGLLTSMGQISATVTGAQVWPVRSENDLPPATKPNAPADALPVYVKKVKPKK